MTSALLVLRAFQLGLSLDDLDSLEYGMVMDMLTESQNDGEKYDRVATQEDFDRW